MESADFSVEAFRQWVLVRSTPLALKNMDNNGRGLSRHCNLFHYLRNNGRKNFC